MAEYSLTPEEVAVFLAAHCTAECLDQITELIMGQALEDLADDDPAAAESAARLAALLVTVRPDIPPGQ